MKTARKSRRRKARPQMTVAKSYSLNDNTLIHCALNFTWTFMVHCTLQLLWLFTNGSGLNCWLGLICARVGRMSMDQSKY